MDQRYNEPDYERGLIDVEEVMMQLKLVWVEVLRIVVNQHIVHRSVNSRQKT